MESRAKSQLKNLVWHDLLAGKITLFHQPSLKFLKSLCPYEPVILTILPESDHLNTIKNACQSLGFTWLNLNLRYANEMLNSQSDKIEEIRAMLVTVTDLLHSGRNLLIHCAGGIHRTGTFAYLLLRSTGYNHDSSINIIQSIRPETIDKIGFHRLDSARYLFEILIGQCSVKAKDCIEQDLICDMTVHDYISNHEMPLLWIKIQRVGNNIFSMHICVTNGKLTKYIPGISIEFRIEDVNSELMEGFLENKQVERKSYLENREVEYAKNRVLSYVRSGFSRGCGILAGYNVHLEREVLRRYFSEVLEYLFYRQIELGTVELVIKQEMKHDNLLVQIGNLKKVKEILGF